MHTSNIAELQDRDYTRGMSEALGAYLKTLREGRKLKANEVLQQLGERLRLGKPVDQTRLWRAESGKGWPEGDFLIALLDILQGSLADVAWIQRNPGAQPAEGVARAQSILSEAARRQAKQLAEQVSPYDIGLAAELTDELLADPAKLARLRQLLLSGADKAGAGEP